MRLVVVDTETTGLTEADQVVEVAAVLLVDGVVESRMTTLVRPTVPVQVLARAAHHITDAELAGAPPASEVARWLPDADVFVAHNAEFDRRMLVQSGLTALPPLTLCTYRAALHLFPDAPGWSNQALRYYLELDVRLDGPPHRALPDATVTAAILQRMLAMRPVDELVALRTTPLLLKTCRLPKHRDKAWESVPSDYMEWVLGAKPPFDDDTRYTCQHWLDERKRRHDALP